MNQYNFLELNNSRIFINEEIFKRLLELTKQSQKFLGEEMCILYGESLPGNNVIFTELNRETDYRTEGRGSNDPKKHSVGMDSDSNIMKELLNKIPALENYDKSSRKAICNIHTHLSGISEGEDYRTLSNADLINLIEMSKIFNKRNCDYISGIIAIDREKGNTSLSLVWLDINKSKKIYRIENTTIYKIINKKIEYVGDIKRKENDMTYLEENFIPNLVFPSVMEKRKQVDDRIR